MTVKTEFDVMDDIFYIRDNKIKEASIQAIIVQSSFGGNGIKTKTEYALMERDHRRFISNTFTENTLFRTKEGAAERWLEDQGLSCGIGESL